MRKLWFLALAAAFHSALLPPRPQPRRGPALLLEGRPTNVPPFGERRSEAPTLDERRALAPALFVALACAAAMPRGAARQGSRASQPALRSGKSSGTGILSRGAW